MLAAVAATLNIGSGDVAEVTPARLTSAIFGSGGPRFIQTILSTARVSGQNALSGLSIFLEGESVDHTFGNDLRIEGSSQTGAEGFRIALEAVDGSSSMLFSGTGVAGTMLFMDVTNNAITSGYPIRAATALGGSTPIVSSTALTLLNSWANQGGGLQQAQVIRNAQNEVHLLAVLSPAAATAAQFATIPAGLRPIGAAVEDGLGFHTAVGAGTGAFLRVATTGAASIINFAVGMGAVVVNTKIPLTTIT
jgi:hypothetical protein